MNKVEKLYKWIMLISCCLFTSVVGHAQNEEANDTIRISLEKAINIACSENPTVIIAGQEIELKKQARREIIGALIPEVSLNGNYSRAIKKQTMAMKFGEETTTIKVGMDNTYNGGLNINFPIFAPSLYRSMNMTKDDVTLAIEKSRASKLDMINEVTKAYLQILLTQDSYKVLLKSYNQAKANYEVVLAKYNQGLVSEYDKIRAEVQMRNLKPSVVSAENAIRLAKMQLKVLMGFANNLVLEVDGSLNEYESLLVLDGASSLYSPLNVDLSRNTDLKQIDINEKMLKQNIKLQKSNYMPTLSASFNYSYLSMNDDFRIAHYKWYPSSSLGVTLSIPLFKASTMAKVKQSKIQLAQLNQSRINAERQISMQANSYLDNMEASAEQIDSNIESVKQALKGREIARKMYEVGRGTILELNDSEVALTQAELAYTQSIYDYVISRAEYNRVLGIDEFDKLSQDK